MNSKTTSIKQLLFVATALSACAVSAVPAIDQSSVSLTQNPRSRLVTVQYRLTGDPAVVTVDFQTNNVAAGKWESIGGEKYAHVIGDVNKLVTNVNATCSIFWQPAKAEGWPNRHVVGGNFRAVVKAWATNAPPPYMIVDLKDSPGQTWYYPSAEAVPSGITNDLYKTTRLAFRLVPASVVQWRMGASTTEVGQKYDSLNYASRETPHLVTFTSDYYMGVYPVTQKQHRYFWGVNPSTATNDWPATETHPVETVLWTDLRGWHMSADSSNPGSNFKGDWPTDGHQLSWKSALNTARNVTKIPSLDLPTEAMWEYACRAGTDTATYAGNITVASSDPSASDPALDEIAWYSANSGGVTHPVGLKTPNAWGFYDMIGNVSEFVLDEHVNEMAAAAAINPEGPETGGTYPTRAKRGGGFSTIAYQSRAAFRSGTTGHANPIKSLGYRLSCDAMALR